MSEAPQADAVVRAVGLQKHFRVGFFARRVDAVHDVGFEVRRGEIFGFLGPNGAGKTTTIKMLMGLIRPSAGRAEILGQRVPSRAAKREVGFLPESPYFYDYLTGTELLDLMGRLCGLDRRQRRQRGGELLERVGLAAAKDRALRKYSKGMLQRVGLAQALIHDPHLVVLDEPMSGLDPIGRKEIRDLILSLRDEGRTVLFSTHILSDVELLCDRVAMVVGGRLRDQGPLDALLSPRLLHTEVVLEQDGHKEARRLSPEVDVDASLREALAAGKRVVSVTPRRESLEDLFVREVSLGARKGGRVIGRVVALALNTFREAVRDRVLYSLLFFAVLLIASALALGQLSVHEDARVTRDLGLGGIALFGVLIAIFVGVNLVYKELDKKTVFALVSKPLYRHELIVGKFAGMSVTLAVQIAIMTLCLYGVLAVQGSGASFDQTVLRSATLTLLEVLTVTSIAILFSSFSTPFLSGAFTLGVFIIGRSVPELRELVAKMPEGASRSIAGALLHLVPDLHLFYVSGSVVDGRYVSVNGEFVAWTYVAWTALYAAGYVICALVLASVLFARRDFT